MSNHEIIIEELSPEAPDRAKAAVLDSNADVDWSSRDLDVLLENIMGVLPENDKLLHSKRVEKLPWNEIAFKSYSGDDCKQVWMLIQKRLRRFRVLKELLVDARKLLKVAHVSFHKNSNSCRPRPRKPPTAYMMFFMERKAEVHTSNPGISMAGVSKKISEMYKSLSAEVKEVYIRRAAEAKDQYEQDLLTNSNRYPELKVMVKASKLKTPFELYYQNALKGFVSKQGTSRKEFREQCKRNWKALADDERIKWINAAEEESKKDSHTSLRPVLSRKEKLIKEKYEGKPTKPPNSAYHLFLRNMLQNEDLKDVSPKERMNYIASLWRDIPEDEKEQYREEFNQVTLKYKADYSVYLQQLPVEKQLEELQSNVRKRTFKTDVKSDAGTEESQDTDVEVEVSCKKERPS